MILFMPKVTCVFMSKFVYAKLDIVGENLSGRSMAVIHSPSLLDICFDRMDGMQCEKGVCLK